MAWEAHPDAADPRTLSRAGAVPGTGPVAQAQTEWTDEALMAAITARDDAAFGVLYDRYADLVYSAAYRVLGDAALAEDAVQEIFVRLWRRPETFIPERGRFLAWLMSVVRNRAVDELRARGRRRRHETATGSDEQEHLLASLAAPDGDDPTRAAQRHEEQTLVRGALRDLPRDQKVALELAYFGGMTQQEIAAVLHEPLGTVKTRIRLGMQKLRRALDGQL